MTQINIFDYEADKLQEIADKAEVSVATVVEQLLELVDEDELEEALE